MTSEELLGAIRERASQGAARFVLIEPQSDPTQAEHPDAERRLRRALSELRGAGIEAHGWVAHPDPFEAAMEADRRGADRRDHRVDVRARDARAGCAKTSSQRLRDETKLPVTHVMPKKAAPA